MHLLRPVAQRVHDQPQRLRAVRVQRVAAARVVDVEAPIILQAVVGGVVEPAQTQGGTVLAALGGVVEDDVEDDLEPGGVQRLDHRLELDDLPAVRTPQCVLMVRGEEADRLIAPVIAQPASDQPRVMDELVHGKQLNRRDAEPQEMVDGDRMPQAGVGAAQRARDVGMPFRKALDVELVDDRVRQRDARRPVAAPVKSRRAHDRARNVGRRIDVVALVASAGAMPVDRRMPAHVAVDGPRVGIQQKLGRIAAQASRRVPRPVHAEAVAAAREHTLHAGRPHRSFLHA